MLFLFPRSSDPAPVRQVKTILRLLMALFIIVLSFLGLRSTFLSPASSDKTKDLLFFTAMGLVSAGIAIHAVIQLRNEWLYLQGLPSPIITPETVLKKRAEINQSDMEIYSVPSSAHPSSPTDVPPLRPLPTDVKPT